MWEQVEQYIVANYPQIIEWALIFLAYFFVALYRSKAKSTKRNFTTIMKERVEHVDGIDKALRETVQRERDAMQKELEESKKNYQAAIDKIAALEQKATRLENALGAMFEEVTDNEPNSLYEES